jgi:glycosyltransferase involved in cell wall biosynthesis
MTISDTHSSELAIVHYSADVWEHVCPVLRVVGPAQQAGWSLIHGNEWVQGSWRFYPERVEQGDVVLIQRDFPRHAEAYRDVIAKARALSKPVIYELDDLLTDLPEIHPDYERYMNVRAAVLAAIVEADAVICSTPTIRNYVHTFNPNIWVFPNYLNENLWTLQPMSSTASQVVEAPLILGYLGARSHKPDLEMIVPVLERILEQYGKRITLRLWGMAPPPVLNDRENVEWLDLGIVDYAQFSEYFSKQKCDIFIAPLLDNLFNRSKSPIKFLEYSALGIPGVYSYLTPYENVVTHGENGFLAGSLEEWEQCLVKLIENADLRHRMGAAALVTLQSNWLLSDHISEWRDTFRHILTSQMLEPKRSEGLHIAKKFYQWHLEGEKQITSLNAANRDKDQAIQALSVKVGQKEYQLAIFNEQLTAIHHSTGWKMLEVLYTVRLKLAPRDSRRERMMGLCIQSIRILKNEGLGSLLRKWRAALTSKDSAAILGTPEDQLQPAIEIQDGGLCPPRATSVIIEDDVLLPVLDVRNVLDWVKRQTLDDVEVVLWNRSASQAQTLVPTHRSWHADDFHSLCQGLGGRYLCYASQDLLEQNETYLETNLFALESEGLVFTVNTLGASGWAIRHLHLGKLPGDRLHPFFRMVIRKEYVQENYSLGLHTWLREMDGMPSIVGKVLTHTTQDAEVGEAFLLETQIGNVHAVLQGRHIIACLENGSQQTTAIQVLHTLESVLPPDTLPSDLPTVFVIMPFLAVGGAEQIHLKIMQILKERFRFVVVTFDELDHALGTTADAFRQVTPYVYTLPDFLNSALNPSFMTYLIHRFQPRTLYIANGSPWIYDGLAALRQRFPGLRIVDQVYDSKVGWINRYDPGVILHTDGYIGVNARICQAYIDKGAEPSQVYLIENGIVPAELNPADYNDAKITAIKNRLNLPSGKRIVTFASRLHSQKRPVDFVELARRFVNDPTVFFLMVGDGPLADHVDAQISKIGLKNIQRHPFYRPISDILAVSDVLVLPSDFEGMPMVIIEAQTMGKPVVATDVGNNREVLEYTQGGEVISHIGDVGQLATAVHKMLASPPDPAQLRQTALSRYDIVLVAQKYYTALMGEPNA